jgi:D-cysteine desulfhydrase
LAKVNLAYPRKVDLACTPTPLQFMQRASKEWGRGHRLWIKRDDLTGSLLSGNKVRKLEFIAAHAIDNGYDTLITCGGIQSNHARATAFVGAQLGLKVHLILRGEEPEQLDGNLLLGHLAGATIECHPRKKYSAGLDQFFEKAQASYAAQGHKALLVPTGGSNGIGAWGYISACEELVDDFDSHGIDQAHIVTASGSGGTQAGLSAGIAVHQLPATLWGVNVCDDEAYFLDKIQTDLDDWRRRYPHVPSFDCQPRILDGYVGSGYGIASAEVFELIAQLARLEGIVLDPVYTGKAFQALVSEIEKGTFDGIDDIVFMHTGGTFGIFPQREGFQ